MRSKCCSKLHAIARFDARELSHCFQSVDLLAPFVSKCKREFAFVRRRRRSRLRSIMVNFILGRNALGGAPETAQTRGNKQEGMN
jgi:hypothetical protein